MRSNVATVTLAIGCASLAIHCSSAPGVTTRTVEVVDRDFGMAVADPYRWMEGADNAELTSWLRARGDEAGRMLAKLPGRDALLARVRELGLGTVPVFEVQAVGERIFFKRTPAGAQLAQLCVREADGRERVLVDPATLATADTHFALAAYSASEDGALVSYVVAPGGGEIGTLHVMDVTSGNALPDTVERVWGEGAASWLPDNHAFFYTQLAVPRASVDAMANQIARLHRLGEPVAHDIDILGRSEGATLALAPEEWPGLWAVPDSAWVIAFVGGAHSEQRVAIAKLAELDRSGASKTPWRELAGYADGVEGATIHNDRLYVSTFHDAPNRKILSMPLDAPLLANARVEIAEDPSAPLVSMNSARDALYLVYRVDGRARLVRRTWDATVATPIELPLDGWIPDLSTDLRRDGITLQLEDWLHPGAYYTFTPAAPKVTSIGLASTTNADFSNVVADEVEATSADGTHVPLSILHLRTTPLDGSHPTILYGYGAYGASESPGFGPTRLAWIERGGVFAIAHVRGGGERGRAWQDAGSREHKLAGIADLIGCAQYLIDRRFTTAGKLAIEGASMGGILIGRALVERPDLFAAAHIGAGFVDPLRLLAAENGANQKLELGDPTTPEGYRGLLAMDPYQHVAPHTAYPAVIFTVGLHDHRVAPWMTSKFAARLASATTSGKPVAIRVDADAGHGHGSTRDQTFAERADVWSFFLAQLR